MKTEIVSQRLGKTARIKTHFYFESKECEMIKNKLAKMRLRPARFSAMNDLTQFVFAGIINGKHNVNEKYLKVINEKLGFNFKYPEIKNEEIKINKDVKNVYFNYDNETLETTIIIDDKKEWNLIPWWLNYISFLHNDFKEYLKKCYPNAKVLFCIDGKEYIENEKY